MNEEQQLIVETARRIFSDQCDKPVVDAAECGQDGEPGTFPRALWETLEQTGLTTIGVDAGSFADAHLVIREAGAAAAPIPLADHLVALQLLSKAGIDQPQGIMTLGFLEDDGIAEVRFSEIADWVLVVHHNQLWLLQNQGLVWQRTTSIAGESLGAIIDARSLLNEPASLEAAQETALGLGASTRVSLMAGAMSQVLELSVQYVSDREQFGRALAKFQAIQHQLAVMAGEIAACQRAADAIIDSSEELDIAIAKARLGEAVKTVAEVSHQVHGAIGYTLEHSLNHRTRRLWQWRDEYGSERYWQLKVGRHFCRQGADQLWGAITNLA